MSTVHELAVLAVCLAITNEHPEALHDLTLDYHASRIPVMLIPDVLGDALDELEMALVLFEGTRRVFGVFVHG